MSENSCRDTDDVSDYGDEIPPEIVEAAKEVSLNKTWPIETIIRFNL